MRYHWPGNVRELQNALERAAIMSEDGHIDHEALLLAGIPEDGSGPAGNGVLPAGPAAPDPNDPALDERERVIAALERTGWVQAKAARLLGMTPRQIAYRIKTLDIPVKSL